MKTKILIVDDYNIFRKGLRLLIEQHTEFEVVGEVTDSKELFEFLEKALPDLILMDLMLPQKSVISISKSLHRKYPDLPYILITVNIIEHTVLECISNGAKGILWKESKAEELFSAIKTVVSGERYFVIPESKIVTQVLYHFGSFELDKEKELLEISAREIEVIKYFAEGYSYKQIGDIMKISPRTVESHKNNILSKLNINSTVDLVKYAIKHNLIELS